MQFVPRLATFFLTLAKNLDAVLVSCYRCFRCFFAPAKLAAIVTKVGGISAALDVLKGKLVAAGLANPFTALAIEQEHLLVLFSTQLKSKKRFNELLKEGSVVQVNEEIRRS